MGREGEVKVKSLQKAMEVLECFIQKQPLGVTEISEKLGLYKSNVHNILMTFTALGYLLLWSIWCRIRSLGNSGWVQRL